MCNPMNLLNILSNAYLMLNLEMVATAHMFAFFLLQETELKKKIDEVEPMEEERDPLSGKFFYKERVHQREPNLFHEFHLDLHDAEFVKSQLSNIKRAVGDLEREGILKEKSYLHDPTPWARFLLFGMLAIVVGFFVMLMIGNKCPKSVYLVS